MWLVLHKSSIARAKVHLRQGRAHISHVLCAAPSRSGLCQDTLAIVVKQHFGHQTAGHWDCASFARPSIAIWLAAYSPCRGVCKPSSQPIWLKD